MFKSKLTFGFIGAKVGKPIDGLGFLRPLRLLIPYPSASIFNPIYPLTVELFLLWNSEFLLVFLSKTTCYILVEL